MIVFAESEEGAVKAASPLRSALWGVHKLAVLLPSGLEPIKARWTLIYKSACQATSSVPGIWYKASNVNTAVEEKLHRGETRLLDGVRQGGWP